MTVTDTLTPDASALRLALTQVDPARRRKDRFMRGLIYAAFVLAMIPLVSLIWSVLANGLGRFDLYFLTHSMRNVYGGMDAGGVYHALLGTLLITGLAALISVPIGILTAVYLVEYGSGALARSVTFFVDVMTGIPSIVAGLFAFSLFYLVVGPDSRSGFVGAVALSVLMIPIVIRSTEEMLRLVPNELREASLALGVPKWLTIIRVVLRTAVAGITTGVMIAIARVIGETAPLLITVGATDSINRDPFEGNMMTLPVYVYRQYAAGLVPCTPGDAACIPTINYDRAWSAALVLILVVMLLNLVARGVSRWFAPKTRA
ncbi:phosphate transport system permease protein PstA [Cellulomonas chitinilytica]|uniref:Phosphate transport system permease protein PstA n=1 Tax=Cellulomonas chitinilytica TaxID=398759 RepID=A0A919U3K1_9CELL|nr:phosphate ABC transporter permease PstA [Cellulomonas chitinilytica]GIG22522.1 phosphate transport system permease protein PstA [Cellulomonas chitinilytica]